MEHFSYDRIAPEYYDREHITSRNFDSATRAALAGAPFAVPEGAVLEIGAGRGRAGEFLKVASDRVVQLDNSLQMFSLEKREPCMTMVHASACSIPLVSQQFAAVVGFLVDPFLGLNSLSESYRMLVDNGQLFITTPTSSWGLPLRELLGIDPMTTRFKLYATNQIAVLPSHLYTAEQITDMLGLVGFREIQILDHFLPRGDFEISPDIRSVADAKGMDVHSLPIIHTIRASR